ncbi:EAL domain-containing protein [Marispirochaeta sp.]|jgi:diguanylate cyclase (GGDEF)-like protein/PAS domain S-box-containing protein|uniref:EAL domain-containing protein n=1 Tax=Marispirochaeta sp. TaxID=2038653 RepID=UPI0029C9189E|nr:EAL domain-containing protein [Marispirochaeta sp.]
MSSEKILIVEDERIIAIDLQRRLENFGYQVTGVVATGRQAIESVESTPPDIILMDIMLSGDMDGIDTAEIIKDRFEIPVMFLTAYSDEKTLERAKHVEPLGYILKPFKEKELYTSIDIALYKYAVDRKLKWQERWYSAMFSSIEDGIIATGTDGYVRFVNPVASSILGRGNEELIGNSLGEVLEIYDSRAGRIDFTDLTKIPPEDLPFRFQDTILINHSGDKIHVDGSFSMIHGPQGDNEGSVVVLHDTSVVKHLSDRISYQASHDILTGLSNREAFSVKLNSLVQNTLDISITHALLYIDLDQFKVVNDTLGHRAGDEMLLQATSIIKSMVRASDFCARLGGDEFGVILAHISISQAKLISDRLLSRLVNHKMVWDDKVFTINSSIGLVKIDNESKDIQAVLAAADDACFTAKEEGGNKIKLYDSSANIFQNRRNEMTWISKLNSAIEEDRLVLYYQPIVPLNGKYRTIKNEILLRIVSPEGDLIMPGAFIPAAERYNFMPTIDKAVVKKSLSAISSILHEAPNEDIMFSINLSAGTLANEQFLETIGDLVSTSGVPAQYLCFEVTETAAISNMQVTNNFIKEMRNKGYSFSLDDFGSGFSSFNYLKTLPVDYLKIDGTFVSDMDENPIDRSMVEAINNLGHIIGTVTVAEFVRSREILLLVQDIGVDYAQGYEIAAPSPLTQFSLSRPPAASKEP